MTQSVSAAYNAGSIRSLVKSHSKHFRDIVSKFGENHAKFGTPDEAIQAQLVALDSALNELQSAVEEDIAGLN
jgi:hypothetical protein